MAQLPDKMGVVQALGGGGVADGFLGNAVEIAVVTRDHRRTMEGLARLGIGPWRVYTFSPEKGALRPRGRDRDRGRRQRRGEALTPSRRASHADKRRASRWALLGEENRVALRPGSTEAEIQAVADRLLILAA